MLFHREPAKRDELADGLQMIDDGIARAISRGKIDPRVLANRLNDSADQVMKTWACTSSIGY
jgi:hypothetical protein